MATTSDVEQFLRDFKMKMSFWELYIVSRDKNDETLLFLEISHAYVKAVLESLDCTDYSEGPMEDTMNMGGPMWVFGRQVKGREVYIKISIGRPRNRAICISFHMAEYPMNYPLKI